MSEYSAQRPSQMPKYLKRRARVRFAIGSELGTVTKIDGRFVWVKWDDGTSRVYNFTWLRKPGRAPRENSK